MAGLPLTVATVSRERQRRGTVAVAVDCDVVGSLSMVRPSLSFAWI
jgi:hypothetical protein